MRTKLFLIIIISSQLLFLASCSSKGDGKDSQLSLMKATQPEPILINYDKNEESVAQRVQEEIEEIDEIYDVAVIERGKKVLVAYKVKHLQRFRMKKIEKNLTKRLKDEFQNHQFTVSSDYKIFLESIRLKEKIETNKISDEEAEKKFEKIIKLKKEMT
ncbi:YhcN/YlaJ family sporulation lipoprotein [Bacillus niameyensis]|uniref:YhcN/YlaJ family sporulation lipoprotein n=1 Tax=Bacillus niameyensis TaxID=1522308 RepID=UPI00078135CF|nr:YhcN/YlaJ family sporulation lipoprotein [Bacillus niameyensis]